MGRMEFGPSVVPELREILLSTSEGAFYGPDGRLTEVREVPFLGARRDWAEDTIDKADWLDIKQRTEARIATARKEYGKLTGSAAVFGDIPTSDMVRDAWEDWNTDRRRAAVKAVLNRVIVSPHTGRKGGPNLTPELKLQFLCDRTEFDWRF